VSGSWWALTLWAIFVFSTQAFKPLQLLDLATSFSVCRYVFRMSRSRSSFKVMGSRSRQQKKRPYAGLCSRWTQFNIPLHHIALLTKVYILTTTYGCPMCVVKEFTQCRVCLAVYMLVSTCCCTRPNVGAWVPSWKSECGRTSLRCVTHCGCGLVLWMLPTDYDCPVADPGGARAPLFLAKSI